MSKKAIEKLEESIKRYGLSARALVTEALAELRQRETLKIDIDGDAVKDGLFIHTKPQPEQTEYPIGDLSRNKTDPFRHNPLHPFKVQKQPAPTGDAGEFVKKCWDAHSFSFRYALSERDIRWLKEACDILVSQAAENKSLKSQIEIDNQCLKMSGEERRAAENQNVRLQAELDKTCKWTPNESYDDEYCWETECGKAFSINEGTPIDNGMKYCAYCGGKLLEQALKD